MPPMNEQGTKLLLVHKSAPLAAVSSHCSLQHDLCEQLTALLKVFSLHLLKVCGVLFVCLLALKMGNKEDIDTSNLCLVELRPMQTNHINSFQLCS